MGFLKKAILITFMFLFLSVIQSSGVAWALVIINPQNGATFNEGDSFTIRVEPSPGDPQFIALLLGAAPIDHCPVLTQPPYECLVTIPPGSPGKLIINAIGKPLSGDAVAAETVTIFVRNTAILQELILLIDKKTIVTQVGDSDRLRVYGKYSDGIDRKLSDPSTGTTYKSSDDNVARVSSDGRIDSISPGKAVVIVRNGNKQLLIQVIVEPK